jgi:hypothetical protein
VQTTLENADVVFIPTDYTGGPGSAAFETPACPGVEGEGRPSARDAKSKALGPAVDRRGDRQLLSATRKRAANRRYLVCLLQ